VILGFLALTAAIQNNLPLVFLYLAIALLVDGIDGSLARWIDVKEHTPNINGENLDNIIDFLNYVFIPVFVIYWLDFVPKGLELVSVFAILTVSCYTFSNNNIKTHDFHFSGFPALWNIVVLYFYILETEPSTNFLVICVLSILTFIPIKYLHPFRVSAFRKTSLLVLFFWMISTSMILYFDELPKDILDANFLLWILTNLYFAIMTIINTSKRSH